MSKSNPFELAKEDAADKAKKTLTHVYGKGKGHRCITDPIGFKTPGNKPPAKLKVDTHAGFVPLWAEDVTLRWRFNERSMQAFANPDVAKEEMRNLFGEALLGWGDAAPVKFTEKRDAVDFEIVFTGKDDCDGTGCVLASAFFPDGGRHKFFFYPKMFQQVRREQVETFEHETGHIFGLRHWFANISESEWSSTVFGKDGKFTIMNYGGDSRLTRADKSDLAKLYKLIWSGQVTNVNGTPIRLFKPYSSHL